MYPDAYAYLHAGDSELPRQLTEGYACVQGNCDYYGDYELELVCEVENDGGFKFIHSSCGRGVTISDIDEGYYARKYRGARRILEGYNV